MSKFPALRSCLRFQVLGEQGQALVEYTLVLALVAIASIAALTALGGGVIKTLEDITSVL